MAKVVGVSYSEIEKQPHLFLKKLNKGLLESVDGCLFLSVGHLEEERAFKLLESLVNISEEYSVNVAPINVEDAPFIFIEKVRVN